MFPGKLRAFQIPAQSATHPMHFVRNHRFAVARATKNNSTFAFATRNRLRGGSNEKRIIYRRLGREGAEILCLVSKLAEENLYSFLQFETGVIGSERNLHRLP